MLAHDAAAAAAAADAVPCMHIFSHLSQLLGVGELLSNAGQGTLVAREVVRQTRLRVLEVVLTTFTEYGHTKQTPHTEREWPGKSSTKCMPCQINPQHQQYESSTRQRAAARKPPPPHVHPAVMSFPSRRALLTQKPHTNRTNPGECHAIYTLQQ